MRVGRMLKHAAISPQGIERGFKTSTVIAQLELMRLTRAAVPESTPSLAGRVRNHWMRSVIQARIPFFIPRVNTRQAKVSAVRFYVKGCNQFVAPETRRPATAGLWVG